MTSQTFAQQYQKSNLRQLYLKLSTEEQQDPELRALLREHDQNSNVRWALSHYRSAVRYLDAKPKEIEATGGTNWQKYLPPRFQKVVFFPELWTAEEIENWGKAFEFQ
jgi:tryptophan 2,3-dioxygenase